MVELVTTREQVETCTNPAVKVMPMAELDAMLVLIPVLSPKLLDRDKFVAQIRELMVPNESAQVECDFTGEVDVTYTRTSKVWQCPRCGFEHDIDITDDIAEMRLSPDERDRL